MSDALIKKTLTNSSLDSDLGTLPNISSMQASPISTIVVNDFEENKEVDFFEVRASKVRISKKNRIMKQQLSIEDLNDSYTTCFSQENFERLVESQLSRPPERTGLKLEPGSCFLWYILPAPAFKDVISDYEMKKCKQVFKSIIKKLPDCHEAHFGIGKLLAHQGLLERARKHLLKALTVNPNDKLYKIWNLVVHNKEFKNRAEALSFCSLTRNLFNEYPNQLEVLWGRMRLGFNKFIECPKDLELPQVTAARIREVDDYYGYLAWSEVFMNEKSEKSKEKGIHVLQELIRCFSYRPEAYLRLWQVYSESSKHSQALEVATECFLKVTDYPEYFSVITLNLSKSNYFLGFTVKSLELLQQKHQEKPTFAVYLYQYGKFCIKTEEDTYLHTGIGALYEVLRNCDKARVGKIYFWLFQAHRKNNDLARAAECLASAVLKLKSSKKIEKVRAEMKNYSKLVIALQNAQIWLSDEKDERIEKFELICEEIGNFDKYESLILYAKALWKTGKELEAIEFLLKTVNQFPRPEGYFVLLKYLFIKEDYRTAHRESKNMLRKSRNSPIQIWKTAHIFYSYSLMHNMKSHKSILLLKCLGKVFPFIPYTFMPYVQQLRKATSIEDLQETAERALDTSINYNESSFQLDNLLKSGYVLNLQEEKASNQDLCYKMMQEESILTENSSSVSMKELNLSQVFNKYRSSKASSSSYNSLNSERLKSIMKTCEQSYFIGYSICSDPRFLYCIAKITVRSQVDIEDGMCAVDDYLRIVQNGESSWKSVLKGLVVKGKLLFLAGDTISAHEILNDVVQEARRLELGTIESLALESIQSFNLY
jgi:tetratricopeptide (TPR) repeat protein